MYHSLLSTTVLQEYSVVDSPWMLVRDRAEKAGMHTNMKTRRSINFCSPHDIII